MTISDNLGRHRSFSYISGMARESTEWKLEHASFQVLVRCSDRYPGDALERMKAAGIGVDMCTNRYGWCLYAIIRPGHPFWEAVSAPNEESYEYGVRYLKSTKI